MRDILLFIFYDYVYHDPFLAEFLYVNVNVNVLYTAHKQMTSDKTCPSNYTTRDARRYRSLDYPDTPHYSRLARTLCVD